MDDEQKMDFTQLLLAQIFLELYYYYASMTSDNSNKRIIYTVT